MRKCEHHDRIGPDRSRLDPVGLDFARSGENVNRRRGRREPADAIPKGDHKANTMALLAATVTLAFCAVGLGGEASAQHPAACGQGYVVERGDTLFKIAERVYGDGWIYKKVFRANRDLLPTEAAIEIGDEIFLPCFDGNGPQTRVDAIALGLIGSAAVAADAAPAEAPTAEPGAAVTAVSDSGFGRFAGKQLTNGGIMTDILARAIESASPGIGLNAVFIEDRSAHLDLLAQGAFQIGYPWTRPDCEDSSIDAGARRLCDEFTFSAPVIETSVGFFVRLQDWPEPPRTRAELAGRKICRTETGFALSLILPGIAADEQVSAADQCFDDLMSGLVDAVAIDRHEAREVIAELDEGSYLLEATDLATSQTMHAIAPTARADAVAALNSIDQGTGALMGSGMWFEIIVSHQRRQLAQAH